jgi:membrane protease YdiL (CAAX protease family)
MNLQEGGHPPRAVPIAHTLVLVALIVAVAAVGIWLDGRGSTLTRPPDSHRIAQVYLPFVAVQLGMVGYVWSGGFAPGAQSLWLGERWPHVTAVNLALAALTAASILGIEAAFRAPGALRPSALVPNTPSERVVGCAVAISAGIGEEIVYRGYLQTRLGALTRVPWLGVILQAGLFGVAHGDRGGAFALRCALYAAMLGALARTQRTLAPGMICHVAIDLLAFA